MAADGPWLVPVPLINSDVIDSLDDAAARLSVQKLGTVLEMQLWCGSPSPETQWPRKYQERGELWRRAAIA